MLAYRGIRNIETSTTPTIQRFVYCGRAVEYHTSVTAVTSVWSSYAHK